MMSITMVSSGHFTTPHQRSIPPDLGITACHFSDNLVLMELPPLVPRRWGHVTQASLPWPRQRMAQNWARDLKQDGGK